MLAGIKSQEELQKALIKIITIKEKLSPTISTEEFSLPSRITKTQEKLDEHCPEPPISSDAIDSGNVSEYALTKSDSTACIPDENSVRHQESSQHYDTPTQYICGKCPKTVKNGIYCPICQKWFHRNCIKMNKTEFGKRIKTKDTTVICNTCSSTSIKHTHRTNDVCNTQFLCGKCFETTNDSNSIGCDGPCGLWFHDECSNLTVKELNKHKQIKNST